MGLSRRCNQCSGRSARKLLKWDTSGSSDGTRCAPFGRGFVPAQEKPAAELLIPITDVDLRKHDDTHIRKSPGDAVWIGKGRNSKLTNASNSPAHFAVVNLWMQQAE